MGILVTVFVGLIAGLLASAIMRVKTGVLVDIILGIAGSMVGGWLSTLITGTNLVTGFNLTTILVALAGSIVVLLVYSLLAGK